MNHRRWVVYKNIFDEKYKLENNLVEVNEVVLIGGMNDELYHQELDLKKEYNEILQREKNLIENKIKRVVA